MSEPRTYNSPIREEQSRATREAILTALFELMQAEGTPDDIPMEAIARAAGVQRRTVFRHFPAKSDLLAAFWPWLNERIGAAPTPGALADLLDGPREVFPRFDAHEAAIRAAIHSRTGREMRADTVAERRRSFAQALSPATRTLPPETAARVEALAHLLFSASAWEILKDYGGLTGAQAGETASWALELILSAVSPSTTAADAPSPDKETRDAS